MPGGDLKQERRAFSGMPIWQAGLKSRPLSTLGPQSRWRRSDDMRSHLLTHFVKSLHLRMDAPMPSELRESHDKVNLIRKGTAGAYGAKILQFARSRKGR